LIVRYSSSVLLVEQSLESRPGASYWIPQTFRAELYSAA
jgi:hypothetical protein